MDFACYQMQPNKLVEYEDADNECKKLNNQFKYGGLATVWDVHDDQLLYSMMLESPDVSGDFWLGRVEKLFQM